MTTLIPKFDVKNGLSTPTGAINRTIYQKLSDAISIKDFGAIGDGTTDDTVAIQNAINSGVNFLYFPKPDVAYLVNTNIQITVPFIAGLYKLFTGTGVVTFANGVLPYACPEWFDGADYGVQVNKAINSVTAFNGIVSVNTSTSFSTTIELNEAEVWFNDRVLTYTGSETAIKNTTGVRPRHFKDLSLSTTVNWSNANLTGLYLKGVYKCFGENISVEGFTTGFLIESADVAVASSYSEFSLRNFSGCKTAIYLLQTGTGFVSEIKFSGKGALAGVGATGIVLDAVSSTTAIDHIIFDSISFESLTTAIDVKRAQNCVVQNARFEGNTTDIIYGNYSAYNYVVTPNTNPIYQNNTISSYGINYEITAGGARSISPFQKTIATGAVTVDSSMWIGLQPETGSTDDLTTLNSGVAGGIYILQSASPSWTITVKNGTGNITTKTGADVTLVGGGTPMQLLCQGGGLKFLQI